MIRVEITERDYEAIDCGYETPCWIWKGRRAKGYANVRVRGTQMSVHRAMYLQEIGPIPTGRVVDHLCEETRCINPAHFLASTIGENVRRSVGFNPTPEQVEEILAKRETNDVLAVRYGVSGRSISTVRRRVREGRL